MTNAPRPPSRLAAAYRRSLGRVPASVWKNLGLYAVGFGLLAVIIYLNWSAKPGKPTDDQKALAFLAGAAANAEAQRANTSPGLVDIFARPINPWPFALACLIWVVALFITFFRWYLLVRAQDLPFTVRAAIRLGLVSYFFNSILPGSVGGDILKAVAVARDQSRPDRGRRHHPDRPGDRPVGPGLAGRPGRRRLLGPGRPSRGRERGDQDDRPC